MYLEVRDFDDGEGSVLRRGKGLEFSSVFGLLLGRNRENGTDGVLYSKLRSGIFRGLACNIITDKSSQGLRNFACR